VPAQRSLIPRAFWGCICQQLVALRLRLLDSARASRRADGAKAGGSGVSRGLVAGSCSKHRRRRRRRRRRRKGGSVGSVWSVADGPHTIIPQLT